MPELKGATIYQPQPHRRLTLRIAGLQKTGKTYKALTAPGPLAYFDLNQRGKSALNKIVTDEGKEIHHFDYNVGGHSGEKDWETLWARFDKDFYDAAEADFIRTLVLDSDTDVWELLRLARFGKTEAIMPNRYTPLNKEMRDLFEAVNATDKNLIVVSEMKRNYKEFRDANGNVRPYWEGDYVPHGWSNTGFKVQMNATSHFDVKTNEFSLYVNDCGVNPNLAGQTLSGPDSDFPFLAAAAYPETDVTQWM